MFTSAAFAWTYSCEDMRRPDKSKDIQVLAVSLLVGRTQSFCKSHRYYEETPQLMLPVCLCEPPLCTTLQFHELRPCTWKSAVGAVRYEVFSALLRASGFCTSAVKPSWTSSPSPPLPHHQFSLFQSLRGRAAGFWLFLNILVQHLVILYLDMQLFTVSNAMSSARCAMSLSPSCAQSHRTVFGIQYQVSSANWWTTTSFTSGNSTSSPSTSKVFRVRKETAPLSSISIFSRFRFHFKVVQYCACPVTEYGTACKYSVYLCWQVYSEGLVQEGDNLPT